METGGGEDLRYINCLNFGELNFIKGNYERDKLPEIISNLKKYKNVKIYDNDECIVSSSKYKYLLRHEPITGKKCLIIISAFLDIFIKKD